MTQLPVLKDWRAEVSCRVDAVGSSFSVFVFLGDIPADPTAWLVDRALAGTFDIFAPPRNPSPPDPAKTVITGFVHLNRAILRSSTPQSPQDDPSENDPLRDDVVLPILRQNINWGVQKVDGEIVPLDKIPSLQVTIQYTPIISPIGGHKNEGDPVYYNDVTRGRTGGYHERQA